MSTAGKPIGWSLRSLMPDDPDAQPWDEGTMETAMSARCSEQSGVANGRANSNGAMSSALVAEAE